jgi:hypothetical protein
MAMAKLGDEQAWERVVRAITSDHVQERGWACLAMAYAGRQEHIPCCVR